MRRQRSIVVFVIVLLSAVHTFAQSVYDPPPAPPRKTLTPVPAALGGVQRPQALGFGDNGESGTYTYDGSGNITNIGSDTFLYDEQGRLKTAVVRGVTGSYSYDAFGNRKTATGETNCSGQTVCATPLTVDSQTNRLLTTTSNNTSVTYDAAGNITSATGGVYAYDGTGMMIQATVGSDDRQFVYTADDERIAVRQGQSWTWTVRGLDNKVLREFTSLEPNFSTGFPTPGSQWKKDYIWRDGLLVASTDTTGTYHYHLDHLGTPRLITNASGAKVAEHAYYPFGAEIYITPHESNEEAMKFTGHERDTVVGDGHTLDDMHARYYNASLGRFLSVDPVLGTPDNPQSWNRYAYVLNSPVGSSDPTGKVTTCDSQNCTTTADTYDQAHSTGRTAVATPEMRATAVAEINKVEVKHGPHESSGYGVRDANGKLTVKMSVTSLGNTTSNSSGASVTTTVPSGAEFAIHGHTDNKTDGMVDSPVQNRGYGDTQSLALRNPIPNATVSHGQVGWHEIQNGQLSFTTPVGAVNSSQQRAIQSNLNAEQKLPAFWQP